jgi:hypothetical protein
MRIALEIVVVWVVLSCTLGPGLTWLLFYEKRRARSQRALAERRARQRDGAEITTDVRAASVPLHVANYSALRADPDSRANAALKR